MIHLELAREGETVRQQVLQTVIATLQEINRTLPPESRIEVADGTVLFGTGGSLDSFGLVTLIVGLEQRVEQGFGIALMLSEEVDFWRPDNPHRTVHDVADYVATLVLQSSSR